MTPDRILSPHFSFYELTRTDHTDLLAENRHVTDEELGKLQLCAELLEQCQALLGVKLEVHSGRRFLALNKRVGGSERSQHMRSEAVDFSPEGYDDEASITRNFDKLVDFAKAGKIKFGQLLKESDKNGREGRKVWIHISLGSPFRDESRCGEIFTVIDGKTEFVERIA